MGGTYTVTASGGASGNPVTFSIDSSAHGSCSISGATVTFVAVGTCVIDANQAGNASYEAATQVQQSFAVSASGSTPPPSNSAPTSPPVTVCANASLLTGPSSAPSGAVTVPAGDNSSMFAYTLPASTTYWFAAGTHTLGAGEYSQIDASNNDIFIGAPGAIISDDLVTIATGAGVTDTIGTFTDAGGTVASLVVTGTGSLVITNGISDATLTSIDAHALTGSLNLTVTEQVTITGALGGDIIVASGAGDVITVGSTSNALTGAVSITANASGDTMTLTHELAGSTNFISAASGGDTITVDIGTNNLGGTFTGVPPGTPFQTALGVGDTLNLHSGVETFVAAGAPLAVNSAVNDVAWVGSGTTVHLGTTANPWGGTSAVASAQDNATIVVIGDSTGATSGNSPAITTITGFSDNSASGAGNFHLTIDFSDAGGLIVATPTTTPWAWAGNGLASGAQVNEAAATSLANALDIAASATVQFDAAKSAGLHTTVLNGQILEGTIAAPKVGLVDWFQFQGNTYIVETLNSGTAPAAHAALGTGDVVVELTGLVNVTADVAAGHLVFGH